MGITELAWQEKCHTTGESIKTHATPFARSFSLQEKNNISGQITIIPKPELRSFWGDSPTKPPFGVKGRYKLPRYMDKSNLLGGFPLEKRTSNLQMSPKKQR